MKKIRNIIIVFVLAALIILSAPLVSYLMTDDISIICLPMQNRNYEYENGIYYHILSDGLYRYTNKDTLFIEGSFNDMYIDEKKIYCFERHYNSERVVIHVFEKETGMAVGEFDLPNELHDTSCYEIRNGIMCIKYIQKVTNKPFLRFYDIDNDFKELPVTYDRKDRGSLTVFEFEDGRDPIIMSDKAIVSSTDEWLITAEMNDAPPVKLLFDYTSNRAPVYSELPSLQLWSVCGDKLRTVYTVTRFASNEPHNNSKLKYNKYDAVRVYDAETGNILNEQKFHRAEKILRADDKSVITYFNGNYIWYDAENYSELKTEPAPEIENNSEYRVINTDDMALICNTNGKILKKLMPQ